MLERDSNDVSLEPFRPHASILSPPPISSDTIARAPGGSLARAEAAALAERLILGMRVGKVGAAGHVVELRVRAGSSEVGVRLMSENGELRIVLVAEPGAERDARHLERALVDELAERGLGGAAIELA